MTQYKIGDEIVITTHGKLTYVNGEDYVEMFDGCFSLDSSEIVDHYKVEPALAAEPGDLISVPGGMTYLVSQDGRPKLVLHPNGNAVHVQDSTGTVGEILANGDAQVFSLKGLLEDVGVTFVG